jgi:hypothetical protein
MASQKQQNSAKSFETFEALLELMTTSDASNEKASSLAKSVHKKHLEIFWLKIDFAASTIRFLESDSDENELFDDANDDATPTTEDQNGGSSNTLSGAAAMVAAPGAMFEDPFTTQTPHVTTSSNVSKSVKIEERAKNSQKTTKNAKICPKLANRGEKCDKESDCQVQFSHPSRCRHFAKFGIVSDFPKGKGCSWEEKCRFAHVKVCKKTTCSKVDCNLTHLQPKPKSVTQSQNPKSVSVGRKSNSVRSARSDAVPSDQQAAPGKRYNGSRKCEGSRNGPPRTFNNNKVHHTKNNQRSSFLGQSPPAQGDLMRTLSTLVAQFQSQCWQQPSQACSMLSPGTLDAGCCQNCRR